MQDKTDAQTPPSPGTSAAPPASSRSLNETEMLDEERRLIVRARPRDPDAPWIGLALSGGGIRSATFCLGALQRLARANILRHFDFMSTVSGGGYTGASLQWWWVRDDTCDAGARFPYGTRVAAPSDDEDKKLAFLRWHANFLTPGGGISIWSVLAVVLRTLIISLLVWIPVAIMVMMLIVGLPIYVYGGLQRPDMFFAAAWNQFGTFSDIPLWPFSETIFLPIFAVITLDLISIIGLIFLVSSVFLLITSILVPPETTDNKDVRIRHARKGIVYILIGAGLAALFINEMRTYATPGQNILTYAWHGASPVDTWTFLISCTFLFLGAAALCVTILQWLNILEFGVNYTFRRKFETYATYGVAVLIALTILASLPFAAKLLKTYQTEKGAILGIVTALSGLFSGFYGHFVQAQKLAPTYATRWFATIAAGAFLYGMILISYLLADFLIKPDSVVTAATGQRLQATFFAILIFSILFGFWSNLNYLGLHRFYRDRLMEAFLPSQISTSTAPSKYSEAELLALSDLWDPKKFAIKERPYPLFNTNVILVNDKNAKRALRGGDSFVLSPLFVGSSATKWMRTTEHGDNHGALTLATAMAASGAAANANAAYIGSGITRDRLISIVMMLLNVRLGVWLGRPGTKFRLIPNYFMPALAYGVLRAGYKSDSAFVELTDGGHFDNLGVYELVRRRVDVILVLDSEEDPSTSMSALASVCQRVLEDFNVVIDIGNKADKLAPADAMGYPNDAKYTARSFFVANIAYPAQPATSATPSGEPKSGLAAKTGKFVYVKSNMLKGLSFPAKGYKANNPDFPNQSTMDQFFDPAQFEAYRELGFFSIESFVDALSLEGTDRASFVNAIK